MLSKTSDIIWVIDQAAWFLEQLDPDIYTKKINTVQGPTTIGQQIRHILDKFANITECIKSNSRFINYEQKRTGCNLEQHINLAKDEISKYREFFETANINTNAEITIVRLERWSTEKVTEYRIDLRGALSYVIDHSVHHFALISAYFPNLNYPETFGLSPSTYHSRKTRDG